MLHRPTGWAALGLGCAIALLAIAIGGSPRIGAVEVQGTRHLASSAVSAAAGLVGRPVFTTSAAHARGALLRLPAVRDASVRITLPGNAQILVLERDAVARWSVGGVEWYVDADGVLFASIDPQGAPAVRITDDRDQTRACAGRAGGRCVDPAVVAAAQRLARVAPGELRADAVRPEVRVDQTQGLTLRSGAGWEIRFGGPDDLEKKLANAKKLLSDNPTRRLDYVDVRSPDRIVFSPQ